MPPTPIIASVCEIDVFFTVNGKAAMNTLFYKSTTAWTLADQTNLVAEVAIGLTALYRNVLNTSNTITNFRSRDRRVINGALVDYPLSPPVAGLRGGNNLPGNVAYQANRHTYFSGRSYKGSIRLGGMGETDVDFNTLSTSYLGAVVNLLAGISLSRVTGLFRAVVASPKLGHADALVSWNIGRQTVSSQKTRIRHITH